MKMFVGCFYGQAEEKKVYLTTDKRRM